MGPEPRSFLRIEFEPAPGQEALFGGRRAAAVARAEQRFLRHREQPRRESRRVRAAVRRCRRYSRHPETRRRTRGLPLDRAAWDDHAVAPRPHQQFARAIRWPQTGAAGGEPRYAADAQPSPLLQPVGHRRSRSEGSRVGKGGGSTCRYRGSEAHYKKKTKKK